MSIEAINWVLNDAPGVPARAVAVLMGLANHAAPDGTGSFASQARLARYARKTDRAVRDDLKELLRLDLIKVSKNQGAAGHIRADVRPIVYDLCMWRRTPSPGSAASGDGVPGPPPPGSLLPGGGESSGTRVPGGSTVPGGSRLPRVKAEEDEQTRTASGSGLPPGSTVPPGSTASNDRKQASDKPTTNLKTKNKTSSCSSSAADALFPVEELPAVGAKPQPKARKQEEPKPPSPADEFTHAFWEKFGKGQTQSWVALRNVFRTALSNGVNRDDLARAAERVRKQELAIASGSLQNALADLKREQPAGHSNIVQFPQQRAGYGPRASATDRAIDEVTAATAEAKKIIYGGSR